MQNPVVIPAQAGIQEWLGGASHVDHNWPWTPAFAGVTKQGSR
jgi:hypothetical protein